jgi:LAO/AO transport system kinase
MSLTSLVNQILKGKRIAVAKAITRIENEAPDYQNLMDLLYPSVGKAYRIGITGPPGSGKSTLTNYLTKLYRANDHKVGIVAVDPTSPFTGGAILGDRFRMNELTMDQGVFIRSMATRGSVGGLAAKALEVADVLDASGYDLIIFETVGVGQVELDIAEAADTTLVMVVPEGGDVIQGLKAGLMEIGDVFILNKSDRPGADQMQRNLEYVLHLREPKLAWHPRVLLTVAHKNQNIAEVQKEIDKHRQFLIDSERLQGKRNKRLKRRIEMLVRAKMEQHFWNKNRLDKLAKYLQKEHKQRSPYQLAKEMLTELIENF